MSPPCASRADTLCPLLRSCPALFLTRRPIFPPLLMPSDFFSSSRFHPNIVFASRDLFFQFFLRRLWPSEFSFFERRPIFFWCTPSELSLQRRSNFPHAPSEISEHVAVRLSFCTPLSVFRLHAAVQISFETLISILFCAHSRPICLRGANPIFLSRRPKFP